MSRYPEGTTIEDPADAMVAKRPERPDDKRDAQREDASLEERFRATIREAHADAMMRAWWERDTSERWHREPDGR